MAPFHTSFLLPAASEMSAALNNWKLPFNQNLQGPGLFAVTNWQMIGLKPNFISLLK